MVRREESCSRTLLLFALLELTDLFLQVVADRLMRASARRSTTGGAGRRRRPKRGTPFPDNVGRGDPEAVSVR